MDSILADAGTVTIAVTRHSNLFNPVQFLILKRKREQGEYENVRKTERAILAI